MLGSAAAAAAFDRVLRTILLNNGVVSNRPRSASIAEQKTEERRHVARTCASKLRLTINWCGTTGIVEGLTTVRTKVTCDSLIHTKPSGRAALVNEINALH